MSEIPRLKCRSTRPARIDHLGWADGIAFISFGMRVGLRVNSPNVIGRLKALFPPGWKPASSTTVDRLYSLVTASAPDPGSPCLNMLYADHEELARTADLDWLLEVFESDLHSYVAQGAPRQLFVHAGAVGWQGRAILIPGRSFTGKTTLVSALVRAGATYYSDEFAVLDRCGRVHAFARPLAVRSGGYRQTKLDPKEIGGRVGARPLPVGLVVATKYRSGARWQPRKLTAGQGVLALLAETVSARRRPEKALPILHKVVLHARVLRGNRGEAHQMVDSILSELGR